MVILNEIFDAIMKDKQKVIEYIRETDPELYKMMEIELKTSKNSDTCVI